MEFEAMKPRQLFRFILLLGTLRSASGTENCTIRANLPCEVFSSEHCEAVPTATANWPGRPSLFRVSSFLRLDEDDDKEYPGLKFEFSPPADFSHTIVRGFELKILEISSNLQYCYFFDLRNSTWLPGDINVVFSYEVWHVSSKTTFYTELYSVPKSPPRFDQYRHQFVTTSKMKTIGDYPANWRTSMSYYNNSDEHSVFVQFALAPEEYDLNEYEVILKNASTRQTVGWKHVLKPYHEASFENVCSGEYYIQINPVDPYQLDLQRCRCYVSNRQCRSCMGTITRPFIIHGSPNQCQPVTTKQTTLVTTDISTSTDNSPHVSSTTEENSPNTDVTPSFIEKTNTSSDITIKYIVGPVVGLLAAILCIFILFLCYAKRTFENFLPKRSGGVNEIADPCKVSETKAVSANNINIIVPNTKVLKIKKVFLVYSEDHPCHQNAVACFVKYLNTHCCCEVLHPSSHLTEILKEGTNRWALRQFQEADITILVNSEGMFKRFCAYSQQRTFAGSSSSPIKDIFIPIINICRNNDPSKYISIHFEYTMNSHLLSNLLPGSAYQLMKSFGDFLCCIHGLNSRQDELGNYGLPLNESDCTSRIEGAALLDAIAESTSFIQGNANWFFKMYGDPQNEHLTYDSQGEPEIDSLYDSYGYEVQSNCNGSLRNLTAENGIFDRINEDWQSFVSPERDEFEVSSIAVSEQLMNLNRDPLQHFLSKYLPHQSSDVISNDRYRFESV